MPGRPQQASLARQPPLAHDLHRLEAVKLLIVLPRSEIEPSTRTNDAYEGAGPSSSAGDYRTYTTFPDPVPSRVSAGGCESILRI